MKKIIEYSGIGAVVIVVVTLAFLRFFGVAPQDLRPGLWLTGEVAAMPVTDWSFTDEHAEIYLQTKTAYLIPHSVTVYCASLNGELYLLSAYYTGGTYPEMRSWNRNIVRDPNIRLKIGDQLFDQTVSYVSDESIRRPVYQALGDKYPDWERPTFENMHILAVGPGA
ncbi:MAG: hypothetical protein GKR91_16270 [Pseudomonadales bacterium]|nr:hypothetical protein [Pseudomonadales bacterium]